MKVKLGFIPTQRPGLDIKWAKNMRKRSIAALTGNENIELVYPGEDLIDDGILTDYADSIKTIDFLKKNNISGIIIGTMNFGEEVPILNVIEAFNNLPVMVYATKEGPLQPDGHFPSYSMCGTLGITSGLYKRNIPFKFSGLCLPEEEKFLKDINDFSKTCNAHKSFIGARIGAVGTRPKGFETVSVNESTMIQKYGQKVIPMSLLDLFKLINDPVKDKDKQELIEEIRGEYNCSMVNEVSLEKIARLELVLKDFIAQEGLSCLAIQCWSAIQEVIKISPCLTMGRLTDLGKPAACEVDIFGALTMLVLYSASLDSSAPHIMDIVTNNNEDKDLFLTYHCGNAPKTLSKPGTEISVREHGIFGNLWGKENCMGTGEFQLKPGKVIISRIVENNGEYKMLLTKGEVIESEDALRGSWGWVRVEDLDSLYETMALEGFIHHYCMTYDQSMDSIIDFCKFVDIKTVTV